MKGNRGFTLVELLVVMAIIAILASIVVPNVQRYIVRARVTRAVAEINGMDLSLTAIMTDAGRGNLSQMFGPGTAAFVGWPQDVSNLALFNPALFENAASIYGLVVYDLLRLGRDCLRSDTGITAAEQVIPADTLAKLGTNYMDIGLDSWQEPYRVWPGPWRFSREGAAEGERWPIPFRVFTVDTTTTGASLGVQRDQYVLEKNPHLADMSDIIADWETWPGSVGFPAQATKPAFIWSYGANQMSSQMLYQAIYSNNPRTWYDDMDAANFAGGDDVNNWDSAASWQRFYN